MAVNNNLSLKRITVGLTGDFRTLKEAVDYFNASATSNYEILLSAGHHLITNTITVNNATYNLQIRGLGSAVTFLDASTGLTGNPMFVLKTRCDINKVNVDGSTLTSYGTVAGENFVNYDTTNNMYSEITDIIVKNFYIGVYDTIGTYVFIFNYDIRNCAVAGYRANTANSNSFLDAEVGTIGNCAIACDLLQANTGGFLLDGNYLEMSAGQIGINYTPATYKLDGHTLQIVNNSSNRVGTDAVGFDFSRSDGRDANIFVSNNYGIPNQYPTAKINLSGNSTSTTITSAGTFYKANFTNTSSYTIKYTIANNRITWQPKGTRNIASTIGASVIASSANANIKIAIIKNGNVANGYFGTMTTFCKNSGEAYALATDAYIPNVTQNDYFELWVTADSGNVIVQDLNWLTTTI